MIHWLLALGGNPDTQLTLKNSHFCHKPMMRVGLKQQQKVFKHCQVCRHFWVGAQILKSFFFNQTSTLPNWTTFDKTPITQLAHIKHQNRQVQASYRDFREKIIVQVHEPIRSKTLSNARDCRFYIYNHWQVATTEAARQGSGETIPEKQQM